MKKIFVTGIAGYIGSHCAIELLKQNYHVAGSVRQMADAENLNKYIDNILKKNPI